MDVKQELVPFDGLLGLGPHPASWLFQLHTLGIISEYAIAVCLEPEIGHILPDSVLEQVGFISFGDSYERQAVNMAWTATIPPISSNPRYVLYPGEKTSHGMQNKNLLCDLKEVQYFMFLSTTVFEHISALCLL